MPQTPVVCNSVKCECNSNATFALKSLENWLEEKNIFSRFYTSNETLIHMSKYRVEACRQVDYVWQFFKKKRIQLVISCFESTLSFGKYWLLIQVQVSKRTQLKKKVVGTILRQSALLQVNPPQKLNTIAYGESRHGKCQFL